MRRVSDRRGRESNRTTNTSGLSPEIAISLPNVRAYAISYVHARCVHQSLCMLAHARVCVCVNSARACAELFDTSLCPDSLACQPLKAKLCSKLSLTNATAESSVLKMQTSLRENSGLSLQSISSVPSTGGELNPEQYTIGICQGSPMFRLPPLFYLRDTAYMRAHIAALSRANDLDGITPRTRLTFKIPETPDVGKPSSNGAEMAYDNLQPWCALACELTCTHAQASAHVPALASSLANLYTFAYTRAHIQCTQREWPHTTAHWQAVVAKATT
jgi:hypothetical protein